MSARRHGRTAGADFFKELVTANALTHAESWNPSESPDGWPKSRNFVLLKRMGAPRPDFLTWHSAPYNLPSSESGPQESFSY
jgi:hypothetical protein